MVDSNENVMNYIKDNNIPGLTKYFNGNNAYIKFLFLKNNF